MDEDFDFEFSAPQFHDFGTGEDNVPDDDYFDPRRQSASVKMQQMIAARNHGHGDDEFHSPSAMGLEQVVEEEGECDEDGDPSAPVGDFAYGYHQQQQTTTRVISHSETTNSITVASVVTCVDTHNLPTELMAAKPGPETTQPTSSLTDLKPVVGDAPAVISVAPAAPIVIQAPTPVKASAPEQVESTATDPIVAMNKPARSPAAPTFAPAPTPAPTPTSAAAPLVVCVGENIEADKNAPLEDVKRFSPVASAGVGDNTSAIATVEADLGKCKSTDALENDKLSTSVSATTTTTTSSHSVEENAEDEVVVILNTDDLAMEIGLPSQEACITPHNSTGDENPCTTVLSASDAIASLIESEAASNQPLPAAPTDGEVEAVTGNLIRLAVEDELQIMDKKAIKANVAAAAASAPAQPPTPPIAAAHVSASSDSGAATPTSGDVDSFSSTPQQRVSTASTASTASSKSSSRAAKPSAGASKATTQSSVLKPTQSFLVRVAGKARRGGAAKPPAPAPTSGKRALTLTRPESPKFHAMKRTRSVPKMSSTSLELQKIAEERKAMKKTREQYQKMYKGIQHGIGVAGPVAVPARSMKKLTIPEEPHFHKLKRKSSMHIPTEGAAEPYVSLAEMVKAYEAGTSDRAARTPVRSKKKGAGTPTRRLKPTTPKPFHFATDEVISKRQSRPPLSREEADCMEAAQHQFKAKPANSRVLHSAGDLGVPKVQPRKVTTPVPFTLESEKRHTQAVASFQEAVEKENQTAEAARHFKHRPVPQTAIHPVPVSRPPVKQPTIPEPVLLRSDRRASQRDLYEAERTERMERMEREAQKAKAAAEAAEKEELRQLRRKMSFKAQPFPSVPETSVVCTSYVEPKPLTCPQTPKFRTAERAKRYASSAK